MDKNENEARVPDNPHNWMSLDIYVFSNGQESSPPRKYHLVSEEIEWWKTTLRDLARDQYGPQQSNINLYTTEGRKIETPLELSHNTAYVAVIPSEDFVEAGYYSYLIKASRSWERGHNRRSNKHQINGKCNAEIQDLGLTAAENNTTDKTLQTIVPSILEYQTSAIVKTITKNDLVKPIDRPVETSIPRSNIAKSNKVLHSTTDSMKCSTQRKDNINTNNDATLDRPMPFSNGKVPIKGKVPKNKKKEVPEKVISKIKKVVNDVKYRSLQNVADDKVTKKLKSLNGKPNKTKALSRKCIDEYQPKDSIINTGRNAKTELNKTMTLMPKMRDNKPHVSVNKTVEMESADYKRTNSLILKINENPARVSLANAVEKEKGEQNEPRTLPYLKENLKVQTDNSNYEGRAKAPKVLDDSYQCMSDSNIDMGETTIKITTINIGGTPVKENEVSSLVFLTLPRTDSSPKCKKSELIDLNQNKINDRNESKVNSNNLDEKKTSLLLPNNQKESQVDIVGQAELDEMYCFITNENDENDERRKKVKSVNDDQGKNSIIYPVNSKNTHYIFYQVTKLDECCQRCVCKEARSSFSREQCKVNILKRTSSHLSIHREKEMNIYDLTEINEQKETLEEDDMNFTDLQSYIKIYEQLEQPLASTVTELQEIKKDFNSTQLGEPTKEKVPSNVLKLIQQKICHIIDESAPAKVSEIQSKMEKLPTQALVVSNPTKKASEVTTSLEMRMRSKVAQSTTQNKASQTEWADLLWEAKLHDDGHYSFHLPTIEKLKYYKL